MKEEESGHWYGFVLVCLPTHKLHGASMFQAISGRCVLFQFKRVVYLIFIGPDHISQRGGERALLILY